MSAKVLSREKPGYQFASIVLNDRRRFKEVVIVGGYITRIKDVKGIPFSEEEIQDIVVTHDKWNFDMKQ
ncbi:MAG TPA: hypothetical protein VJU77_08955 [Chthoniobacterales bacterium]|nr:hypothetical protein [Chthoniobacterales bacterium]